jgi:TolB-like protein
MKRCPECNHVETDETLKFCRIDGATLVSGSLSFGESGSADASEVQTSILSHNTQSDASRAAGPTPALPAQQSTSVTEQLSKKRRPKVLIAIAAVFLVCVIAVGYFIIRPYLSAKSTSTIESIAVLPFENASGNAELDYLSAGVSESVIDRLSQLPQLKVIARSSSFQYRGQNLDLKQIADALGVQALVTGRVVQRADGYVIRVDVTDVRENKQLWGENFVRKAADVQVLQTDIAREIAEQDDFVKACHTPGLLSQVLRDG